jgi:hypothetical protein
MSRRSWHWMILALLLVAPAVAAPPAPATTDDARVARLIAELASEDFPTRERANKELLALGKAALPGLEKAVTSNDPEVRRRAAEAAAVLIRKQESTEALQPKRVRLTLRDVTVAAALETFNRQTGASLSLDPEALKRIGDRKVTLDTGDVTYWEAFDKLCDTAGLIEKGPAAKTVDPNENLTYRRRYMRARMAIATNELSGGSLALPANHAIALTDGKAAPRPTFSAGSVRIRSTEPKTQPSNWAALKGDGELLLGVELVPEPGVVWESVQSLRVERAVDDRGQVLIQPRMYMGDGAPSSFEELYMLQSMGEYEGTMAQGGGQQIPICLRIGRESSGSLKELHGVAVVRMQTAPETRIALGDVLKSEGKSAKGKDGSQLSVIEVRRDGTDLTMRVRIEAPKTEKSEDPAPMANLMMRRIRFIDDMQAQGQDGSISAGLLTLFDASGQAAPVTSKERTDDGTGGAEEYRITFRVAVGKADPARLELQGRRHVTAEVPFTLRDVPLVK